MTRTPFPICAAAFAVMGSLSTTSRADGAEDVLVQPPNLAAPQRASLAGSLSGLAFDAEQLARGGFALALPITPPTARGELLVDPWPSYSPETGIGEWGQGWGLSQLEIRRYRALGEIDFATDDLVGPWGVMARGDDGAYYPTGKTKGVRVVVDGAGLRAVTGDGAIYEFRAADAITTPRGTYAWKLSTVRAVTGERADLTWSAGTGRRYLARLDYGGRGGPRQYRIDFTYTDLAHPIIDYRSGIRGTLDRRVSAIRIGTLAGTAYPTALTYDVGYDDSASGPAFYLTSLRAKHASGAGEPPVRYRYDLEAPPPALTPIGALDGYLGQHGTGALLPSVVTPIDADDDGLLDFENYELGTLYRRTATGTFVATALPPITHATDRVCRPAPGSPPRHLAWMAPTDPAPSVVTVNADGASTEVRICDRDGTRRELRTFTGQWQLDKRTRLVDLDRDGRPDLVRVTSGGYEVVANRATGWAPQPGKPLTPAFDSTAVWASDLNGDGIVDLVGQHAAGIAIWYGRGGLEVDPQAALPAFKLANGSEFSSFAGRALSFVDVNQDGATDIVVSLGDSALLFINHGDEFRQGAMPALPQGALYPLALDLSGSGEQELAVVSAGHVSAVRWTQPSTGLLLSADDGRGTEASFAYARADAAPGLRSRPAVLASHTLRTAGVAPVTRTYRMSRPTMHTLGRFLVGFGRVERSAPEGTYITTLFNDDDMAGIALETRTIDATDPLERFTRSTYEEVPYHGLRHRRVSLREVGIAGGGLTAVLSRTEMLAYARPLCPTHSRETSARGTLERTTELATVAAIPDELHCLSAGEQVDGRHDDASLDFVERTEITRNSLGQLTEVAALAPAGRSVLQTVRYDASARVVEVARPGQGTTAIAYDASSGVVARVTAPDGTVNQAIEREALTDLVRAQRLDLGGGVSHVSSFRYDSLDRLAKQWTSLGGTEGDPLVDYAYAYADASGPLATVATHTRVTAAARRTEIEASSGAGELVARLRRFPSGWSLDQLQARDPSALEARRFARAVVAASVPDAPLTMEALIGGAAPLARIQALTGDGVLSSTKVGGGVVHEQRAARVATSSGIVTTYRDGPSGADHARLETHDDRGRLTLRIDETGATTRLRYDALGRLVQVQLPDGAIERQRFDGFGRKAQIERTDIGARAWHYDELGRVDRVETRSRDGELEHTLVIARDPIGRPLGELHVLAATGEIRSYDFAYDGNIPGQPRRAGQLGKLSQSRGPGYTERHVYRTDGRVDTTTLAIDGWRTVRREYAYHDDGAVASETWVVLGPTGAELRRMKREDRYDAHGRIERVLLDGAELAHLGYDGNGDLVTAQLATGAQAHYSYDPVTRGLAGYALGGRGTTWTWNAFGQIDREVIDVPGQHRERTYLYDERGFVAAAADALDTASYTYDPSGLPSSADDLAGPRAFTRDGDSLDAGDRTYAFDDLGRVIRIDALELTYGPDGQLASSRRGTDQRAYVSDAEGRRLIKLRTGGPIEAYIGGAVVTDAGLRLPYSVGGKVVGVLDNGALVPVAADARDTLLSDGTLHDVATPYGVRAARSALAPVLDFAGHGHDAELDAIRMGVRDYDPYLGRFLTPDPLMLESLEACARSSTDCSLYAYGRGNPLQLVDHSGMAPTAADVGTLESVAPAELSQCAPEVLASPASMPAAEEPLEVDGYQGNPFDTLNKIDVDVFAFVGVSVDPPIPPIRPELEAKVLVGFNTEHSTGYLGAAGLVGPKVGTESTYSAAMTGVEVTTLGGAAIIDTKEAGVGVEVPFVAGARVFAGSQEVHDETSVFGGVGAHLFGVHAFGGIGGNIKYDGESLLGGSPAQHSEH